MDDKKRNERQLFIFFGILAGIFAVFFSLHIAAVKVTASTSNFLTLLSLALSHMEQHPFQVVFNADALMYAGVLGFIFFAAFALIKYDQQINGPQETDIDGSAKWNDRIKSYNKRFTTPFHKTTNNGEDNMILTQNIKLSMNGKKTRRNNNILVIGGAGSGKSRFMVKPNILQANANYVITDPAGELLESTGHFLEEQGYEIKVFNLVEMAKSDQYNPFNYIRDDAGVLMMINCLIRNTNPAGQSGGDPFWEKSETALLQALVFYLIKYRPKEERNFTSVMKLLRAAEVDENNPKAKSPLDIIFDGVAAKDPNSIALKQYLTFKMGAGKTLKSILISCSVRLTVFNLQQIENLTCVDTIDLESLGSDRKIALFVIIPAADSTYNFLVSMMYSQLFETLYFVAETTCKGKQLPRHIRFLLDEFANIGQIPEFDKKLATMRKYLISCTIILQNLSQIKSQYKDNWENIVGNCDSFLFLGGQEESTLEYISKKLGNRTARTVSYSSGGKGSKTRSTKQRPLMTPDEISRLDNSKCILTIRGMHPLLDKKYDYPKHKNYKYTADANDDFIYENTKDNSMSSVKKVKKDKAYVEYMMHKAKLYADALHSKNIDKKIITESQDLQSFVATHKLDKDTKIERISH